MLRILAVAPLSALPESASLVDADPGIRGGLYDAMSDVYSPLLAIPGVSHAKAPKLLHIKRDRLFPILDSKLMRLYREPAKAAGRRNPQRGASRLYWAAIREDAVCNSDALTALRKEIGKDESHAA